MLSGPLCRRAGRRCRHATSATSSSARCTSPSTATRRPSCGAGSSSCGRSASMPSGFARARPASSSPGSSPGCAAGVHAPHEAAVDPRALTAALVGAIEAAGGRIEVAEVTAAVVEQDRLTGVRTAAGDEVRADSVVLAAGSWSAATGCPKRPVRRCARSRARSSPCRARGRAGLRADRRQRARLHRPPRGRPAGRRRDRRGAGFRHPSHRRRRARAAARGLPGAARGRRARAGRGDRRAAPGDARQPAPDRPRGDRRAAARHRPLPQRHPARPADRGANRDDLLAGERVEAVAR